MLSKENSKYAPIPCNNPTEKIAKLTNDVAVNKQNGRKDFHVNSSLFHSYSLLRTTRDAFSFLDLLEHVPGDVKKTVFYFWSNFESLGQTKRN